MNLLNLISKILPEEKAYAHCDVPCGVYDPASAKIAAKAVVSMIDKINNSSDIDEKNPDSVREFHNSMTRYVIVKEQQAEICKKELLILWTDYFKQEHLKMFPDLHDTFWKATKICSEAKRTAKKEVGEELMQSIYKITEMFEKVEKSKSS